ncbi:MAG: hypothetical protein NT139_03365 [Candidatus Woesearchaeota archaeon]|nr:hypothetical protein [Candidatus Woesearchaeota archaeon]
MHFIIMLWALLVIIYSIIHLTSEKQTKLFTKRFANLTLNQRITLSLVMFFIGLIAFYYFYIIEFDLFGFIVAIDLLGHPVWFLFFYDFTKKTIKFETSIKGFYWYLIGILYLILGILVFYFNLVL